MGMLRMNWDIRIQELPLIYTLTIATRIPSQFTTVIKAIPIRPSQRGSLLMTSFMDVQMAMELRAETLSDSENPSKTDGF